MEEYQKISDLEKEIASSIMYKSAGALNSILAIVDRAFDGLKEQYSYLHCDVSSLKEYIEENKALLKIELTKTEEERKGKKLQNVQVLFRKMKRKIEETEAKRKNQEKLGIKVEETKQERTKEGEKQEIAKMDLEDKRTAIRITGQLQESLKNILAMQARTLDRNGYTAERIDQITDKARKYVTDVINRNEKNIEYSLQKDSNQFKQELSQRIENCLVQEGRNTPREEFASRLDGNISLEEQNQFAKDMAKKQEEKEESNEKKRELPSDVLI